MIVAKFNATIGLIIKSSKHTKIISNIVGFPPAKELAENTIDPCVSPKGNTKIWIIKKRYEDRTDIETCLQDFLNDIPNYQLCVQQIKQYGTCAIRISIVTSFGQFGFSLSPTDFHILAELGIPLEISVFSLGECINPQDEDTAG